MYKPRLFKHKIFKTVPSTIFFHKGKLKEDTHPAKWRWTCVKQSGARPTTRSGLSLAVVPGNRALCFGGVFDEVSLILASHWLLSLATELSALEVFLMR